MIAPLRPRLEGEVVEYDDHAGFGEVEAGGIRFWFHCTQIADGSRHAEPGQRVSFRVVPGHRGRWEAADVRPCASVASCFGTRRRPTSTRSAP